MVVKDIDAMVLIASTYEKKDDKGIPTGELSGKLVVMVDSVGDDVTTGEILDLFTGREFVGDIGLLNTVNRYEKISIDLALVDFQGKTSKRLVNLKFKE